jgi:fumarylacetoacetate (FAA) hydrolase
MLSYDPVYLQYYANIVPVLIIISQTDYIGYFYSLKIIDYMKLVTFSDNGREQLGILVNDKIYATTAVNAALPATMSDMLQNWEKHIDAMKATDNDLKNGKTVADGIAFAGAAILAPVPRPTSCRDGYAFRQHVAAARRNRKVDMIAEFDQYPIFYFTNHNAIQGPGAIPCMPDHFKKLDFELEAAIVVCRKGRNIKAAEADNYIVLCKWKKCC